MILLCTSCGGGEAGFRIDDVRVSPEEVPVNIASGDPLRVTCTVFNDLHEITEVWANSDEGDLWIALEQDANVRWGGALPLTSLNGFAAGDYFIDVHALDLAGRQIELKDAVRLRITAD